MKIYKTNLALHAGTALLHNDTSKSVNNAYQNFIKAHKETAKMLITHKEKAKQKVSWENETIIEKRKNYKSLHKWKIEMLQELT